MTNQRRIDKRSHLTLEEFNRKYMKRGRPVIIEGAALDCQAINNWTPDYIASQCPDRQVEVRHYDESNENGIDWKPEHMGLHEFLGIIANSPPEKRTKYYIGLQTVRDIIPELANEVPLSMYANKKQSPFKILWLGADSFGRLHFHPFQESIATQIMGSKTFYLFPPTDTSRLYQYPSSSSMWYYSKMNLKNQATIDHASFPLYKNLEPIVCTLNPGDMIYIPVHWWHAVDGPDYNVLITTFWTANVSNYAFPNPGFQALAKKLKLNR